MAEAIIADSLERVEQFRTGWDELAVAAGRPMTAPAWMCSWWRHAAPAGCLLRCVVVRDGEQVIGVAPYYVTIARGRVDYRLIASGIAQRLEPLAAAGREQEVATAIGAALCAAYPRPSLVSLEGVPADSPWPTLLRGALGGPLGTARYSTSRQDAPTVTLAGLDFAGWLESKSSNFRQQLRRMRRKLEKEAAVIRVSGLDEVEADVESFGRLHGGRWKERGGSGVLSEGLLRALTETGRELIPAGRFRLWMIDVDGEAISAQVFLAAGGELAYWNGGFDEQWAPFKPAMVAIFAAIEDAFERGDRRLDLGGGAQDYKLRFADSSDPLQWTGLIPRGPRWPLTRAQLAPMVTSYRARAVLRERLSRERQQQLKRLLGR